MPTDQARLSGNQRLISMIASIILMGLGQILNRQYLKGLLLLSFKLYLIIFWSLPFVEAIKGLITLGTKERVTGRFGIVIEQGDHSIFLMISGIIYLLCFIIFLWLYLVNIRDAYLNGRLIDAGETPPTFKESVANLWEKGFPFLILFPAIVFVLFVIVLPLLFGILIAFTNFSGPHYLPPRSLVSWVGFKTFIDLFQMKTWSTTFFGVFGWTIVWAVLATATTYFVGLFYAILINHPLVKLKKMWRAIYILPWAIPAMVSVLIMRNIFNGQFGPINNYLEMLGFERIMWLSDGDLAKLTIVLINIWFGLPFWMIMMTGVLTGIDKEMYEAADVDGASGWQKFRKLTFPLVMFATAPLLIMSFANNFNNFNIIYLLTEGGPANQSYNYAGSTDILITWIYKLTLNHNQYNIASAVSILIFIVIAALSIWNFRKTRAFKEEDMIQ